MLEVAGSWGCGQHQISSTGVSAGVAESGWSLRQRKRRKKKQKERVLEVKVVRYQLASIAPEVSRSCQGVAMAVSLALSEN